VRWLLRSRKKALLTSQWGLPLPGGEGKGWSYSSEAGLGGGGKHDRSSSGPRGMGLQNPYSVPKRGYGIGGLVQTSLEKRKGKRVTEACLDIYRVGLLIVRLVYLPEVVGRRKISWTAVCLLFGKNHPVRQGGDVPVQRCRFRSREDSLLHPSMKILGSWGKKGHD